MDSDPITIETRVEKWRFECPRGDDPGDGHDDWYLWDGIFCCETCKRHRDAGRDVQTTYSKLRDKKTGELVDRENITVEFRTGASAAGD